MSFFSILPCIFAFSPKAILIHWLMVHLLSSLPCQLLQLMVFDKETHTHTHSQTMAMATNEWSRTAWTMQTYAMASLSLSWLNISRHKTAGVLTLCVASENSTNVCLLYIHHCFNNIYKNTTPNVWIKL